MKANEIMTLEHAMLWAKGKKRRKVTYELDTGYWDDDIMVAKVQVSDREANLFATLPMPFTGDIDNFLCEKEQKSINDQIVSLVKKLETSKENCEEI